MKRLAALCFFTLLHTLAPAETVHLVPVADTTISEGSAAHTSPTDSTMIVGRLTPNGASAICRALLRFDLSSIPSNAIIQSASLTVTVTRSHSAVSQSHALHPLTLAWTEAGATWESTGTEPWSGGVFEEEPDATVHLAGNFGGAPTAATFASSPEMIATVQSWLTNRATNFGWLLRNEDEETLGNARRLASRESLSGRPTLSITYTSVPPAPADFVVTSPGFHYRINGQEPNPDITLVRGSNYIFEISTDPSHPFLIATGPGFGDDPYSEGLSTNNIHRGRLSFAVPLNAPDALYYVCSLHFFGGVIRIVNPSVPPVPIVRIVSMNLSASNVVLRSLGTNGWAAWPEFSSNLLSSNWSVVPGFSNALINGTNVTVFDRLEPLCGPNVFLRVRNTPVP